MMLMDTANIQLIVTMVTKEGQNLLQVMLKKFSVSSLVRALLVDLTLITTSNLHLVRPVFIRYDISVAIVICTLVL